MKPTSLLNPWLISATLLMVSLYGALLYFHAATASLRDTYQPGIETMQLLSAPEAILLLILLVSVVVKQHWLAIFAFYCSIGAFVACAILFVLIATHDGNTNTWASPDDRTLQKTVITAMFEPSFSGRSTGRVLSNGAIAVLSIVSSAYVLRRRYNPTFQWTLRDEAAQRR